MENGCPVSKTVVSRCVSSAQECHDLPAALNSPTVHLATGKSRKVGTSTIQIKQMAGDSRHLRRERKGSNEGRSNSATYHMLHVTSWLKLNLRSTTMCSHCVSEGEDLFSSPIICYDTNGLLRTRNNPAKSDTLKVQAAATKPPTPTEIMALSSRHGGLKP